MSYNELPEEYEFEKQIIQQGEIAKIQKEILTDDSFVYNVIIFIEYEPCKYKELISYSPTTLNEAIKLFNTIENAKFEPYN